MCRIMALHQRILSTLEGNGATRRNLFGPVDHEQLQSEYRAALRKDLEEASKRWGFDFTSDKPLEDSGFQWEDVPDTFVPLPYRPCTQGQRRRVGPKGTTVAHREVKREKENIPRTPEKYELDPASVEWTPERADRAALKRKQTNLTDFYQAKRRVVWLPRKSGE